MPLFGPTDQLPGRPRRVVVAGTSGSGKSTLAQQIGETLQIPYLEIDALYHGPQWTPRSDFAADVAALADSPAWVTEWQYNQARPLLTAATDIFVWLDLSRQRVMWQISRRTVRRRLRRQRPWNDNLEPPLRTFFTNSDHIVRWAWSTHSSTAMRVRGVIEQRPTLPVIQLRSHDAARRWITGPLTDASNGLLG